MARLRGAGGCPWDREQTFASIAPYTIEEAYEVADAIERGDLPHLQDELGDLLFQVVFHAQMAERGAAISISRRWPRHPRRSSYAATRMCSAAATALTADAASRRCWEDIKAQRARRRRRRAHSPAISTRAAWRCRR